MDRNSFNHEPYLVEQLKKGRKEAYGHLFLSYHKELCNYLTAISGDSGASEEIAQQTFIKIWENRSKLQVGKGKLKRYVFKIAYNVFIDTQRRKKKEFQLLESLRQQAYLEIAEVDSSLFEERLKRVEKEIDNLPEQCKKVFILSKKEGLKYKEISEQLHISIKTVEVHMARAMKRLRAELTSFL
ncbi:RNA polymerase sigma-70 factor [Flagellimonas halotolerans]|uniref:RNA polymerase sigma-70 factor n=1 Tax=Flagellimonas halotolerans TaxID=3112164 RepID=A0ABU6ISN2_9FLAO|nr:MULTISPECIES: RNA polymerase sigma-70 factor [unclassified Allomuricauda]MEC3966240.1 RNA polymerase sigma-70 factor [Muricauda sp. SYSU M86414]MEC4266074.1 RNA polymerase sigma-70 factor [Muricauda sp. SYSU M84420]